MADCSSTLSEMAEILELRKGSNIELHRHETKIWFGEFNKNLFRGEKKFNVWGEFISNHQCDLIEFTHTNLILIYIWISYTL